MTDIASLTINIDSTSAVSGKKALDDYTQSGSKAEAATTSLEQAQINQRAATMKAQEALNNQRDAMVEVDKGVQKLLDRYDPLGTKLRQLQSDFAMLDKAATSGGLGPNSDAAVDKTYAGLNAEIAKTKDLMVAAGAAGAEGFGKADKAAQGLTISTAYATRELVVLGREALEGRFSRIPGSFASMVSHTNLFALGLGGLVAGLAAVAAAAGTVIAAFVQGEKETDEMNKAIALTNDYAGVTTTSMRSLAQATADSSRQTIGASKGIVQELVASGRIGRESIGAMAGLIADFATVTGMSAEKATAQLIKTFEDPAKAARGLNEEMHFLTAADLDHYDHLVRIGEAEKARSELADKYHDQIKTAIDQQGYLGAAWDATKKAASDAWDAMMGIGRTKTTGDQLKDAQEYLKRLQMSDSPDSVDVLNAETKVAELQAKYYKESSEAAAKGAKADKDARDIKANDLANRLSKLEEIKKLEDELHLLDGFATANADQQQKKLEAQAGIRQKIFDLQNPGVTAIIGKSEEGIVDDRNKKIAQVDRARDLGYITNDKDYYDLIKQINVEMDKALGLDKIRIQLEKEYNEAQAEELSWAMKTGSEQNAEDVKRTTALRKRDEDSDKRLAAFKTSTTERINVLNGEGQKYEMTKLEAAEYAEALRLINEYNKAAVGASPEKLAALDAEYEKAKKLIAAAAERKVQSDAIIEQQKKTAAEAQKIWDTFTKAVQHALGDGLYNAMQGNFKNIGQAFFQMLQRMLADALAANLTQKIFGTGPSSGTNLGLGVLSAIFGKTGGAGAGAAVGGFGAVSANGSYFDGSVAKFANGGVVNSATPFSYSGGRGVMGEAGPEAIMPLKRDSAGRLGISGGGGGITVTYAPSIHIDSRTDRAEVAAQTEQAIRVGNAQLVDQLQRAGALKTR